MPTDAALPSQLPAELLTAAAIARAAGAMARRYFDDWHRGAGAGALAVEMKEGDEPVTAADRAVSTLCVDRLRAAFPADAVVSEELPDDGSRHRAARTWLVDPIDGTKDFIAGRPGFAVMIGLITQGRPTLGVVYQPLTDRLYFAHAGGGAFVATAEAAPQPLRVSTVSDLAAARVHEEPPLGSLGLKLCHLAAGERDLYVNPAARCKLWDTAAPEIILREAGGQLTDARGEPLRYTGADLGHRRGLLGSNGRLHAAALVRLAPLVRRMGL